MGTRSTSYDCWLVERFWELMGENDFFKVGEVLHDDFVLEWPQTNERIAGRERFGIVNRDYPTAGRWTFRINRLVEGANEVVTDVTVSDGQRVDRSIAFFELQDRRIVRIVEYWPEPGEAPGWRAGLTDRLDKADG